MKTKHDSVLSMPVIRSGGKTLIHTTDRRRFAAGLGALFFSSLTALLPAPAHAQCKQWDVGGTWHAIQSNGSRVEMILLMRETEVTGTARDLPGALKIPVTGTMVGNKFNVTIYWHGGNVGVYRGTVDAGGGMKGTTFDRSDPGGARATWYSNRSMTCADARAPVYPQATVPPITSTTATPPRPPPIKSSGKAKPTPTPRPIRQSGGDNAETQVSPTISANPIAVTVPAGQSQGKTTLTWDAGTDHPEAQVWRKVGIDGEETLVDNSAKGTRVVAVEGGKNHQFILKDAGQQLARAAVIAKR